MSFYSKESAESAHKSKITNQLFVRVNGRQIEKLLLPSLPVLRGLFNEHGKVVKIISVKEGLISFVTFESPAEALTAKNALNGHEFVDNSKGANLVQSLFVDFAREKCKEIPRKFVAPPSMVTHEVPRPIEVKPLLPVLDVESANLPMVYLFPDQRPKIKSSNGIII
jgi:hypothetical protein